MKKSALSILSVISCFTLLLQVNRLAAQDTLTVMAYNLLNYPNILPTRYDDLREIVEYTKPDIFLCNEITSSTAISNLLNNSFNVAPVNYYASSSFEDGPDTDNLLFYNTNKVTLVSQNQISTLLRDISHYRVYTCASLDTVWYDLFSLHLKASQGWTNAQDRLAECVVLTNYLATLPLTSNIIVGGDFNFYGVAPSVEPAWNQLTVTSNPRLYDPLNMPGEWHTNNLYKNIHTQSTRSAANPGCCGGSTGGMDDRFDFLFINQNLRDGLEGAQYIPGTYKTIGQDGNHFNQSIIEGAANSSVPANVNTALFNMSDHLPVLMKVATCDITIGIEETNNHIPMTVAFTNENQIVVDVHFTRVEKVNIEIISTSGAVVAQANYESTIGHNKFTVDVPGLARGIYTIKLTSTSDNLVIKFLK